MKIFLAFILDLILGDPEHCPHPVRWIGALIVKAEEFLRKTFPVARERLAGIYLVISICGIAYAMTFALVYFADRIHPLAGRAVEIFLIYTAISARSLADHAFEVSRKLRARDLVSARKSVGKIVGRDTEKMSETEVIRATVETVAENTVDGILSPLFFAMLGGAPLAMLFKAASTLDSMVGHRNERYEKFGWASARFDDILNWIPARISYLLIPAAAMILKFNSIKSYEIAFRDGLKHPSPNSGISEAAFAGALGVQLGGVNFRKGNPVAYPMLGDASRLLETGDIARAVQLSFAASGIWVLSLTILSLTW